LDDLEYGLPRLRVRYSRRWGEMDLRFLRDADAAVSVLAIRSKKVFITLGVRFLCWDELLDVSSRGRSERRRAFCSSLLLLLSPIFSYFISGIYHVITY